jgi:RNA polymerase sigma-70 factor (ECF subfamily)
MKKTLTRLEVNLKEYEKLFSEYYGPLLRYCCTMVSDIADAEDLVQQVFVRLWLNKGNSNSIHTSARAYLYKAVYNAGLDFLKHKKVRKRYEEENLNASLVVYADDMGDKELQKKIQESIAQLPDQCGRIFRMNRFENMKYREIAAQLNIDEKTVENQMGKALKTLKSLLKEFLPILLVIIYL